MASVSGINSNTAPDPASGSSKITPPATDPLSDQSTFLTLLVSQLKNQNPMNPMDGTTFVTQLAQFSDLQQSLAMRQDLDSLTAKYLAAPATTPASKTASGSAGSSGTPRS